MIGSGELARIKRAVSNHSVDGAANLGVAQLRLGAPIFPCHSGELAASRFQRLLLAQIFQVVELFLRLLILAARLRQSDLRGIEIAPRKRALLK